MEELQEERSKEKRSDDSFEGESKVFGYIQKQIVSGALKAGDKLPSERRLCEILGASRG